MKYICALIIATCILSSSGCASTTVHTYRAVGENTICGKKNRSLGYIAVLPEVAWRSDQKEPEKRQSMVRDEVEDAFADFPCGSTDNPGGIREFSNWSSIPESEILDKFSNEGVDTIVLVRVEEFTPLLNITFSLPFLWTGSNEANFRIRVISVTTGEILHDLRIKRSTGGPFNIRPAESSRAELNSAMYEFIGKQKNNGHGEARINTACGTRGSHKQAVSCQKE